MEQVARNETAYTIGFLFGLFGECGVAHLYRGKATDGLVWMLIKGPLHFILAVLVSCTVIGLLWALPFWFRTVQRQANEGATL